MYGSKIQWAETNATGKPPKILLNGCPGSNFLGIHFVFQALPKEIVGNGYLDGGKKEAKWMSNPLSLGCQVSNMH